MIVSCDMGGAYRSTSGGTTWEMIDWHEIHSMAYSCGPVFSPINPSVVIAYGTKGNNTATLMKSSDKGVTWSPLTPSPPWGSHDIIALHIDNSDTNVIFAGTDSSAFLSASGGTSWNGCHTIEGKALGFFTKGTIATNRVWFAATDNAVYSSSDGGATWAVKNSGLPTGNLKSFVGGSTGASSCVLYCIISGNSDVYRSLDGAETWVRTMEPGIDTASPLLSLTCATNAGNIVYVNNEDDYAIYKSSDTGNTWKQIYTPNISSGNVEFGWLSYESGPGWGGPLNLGFSANLGQSDVVMGTNTGETILTKNGGASWQQVYSKYVDDGSPAKGKRWASIGLEVTTVWHYYIDPFDSNKHYISYTDIGCGRSVDGGKSWYCAVKGSPWQNTFYEMAFDSSHKGTIYAAAAGQHDIPYWTQSEGPKYAGGVVKSDDFGKTWTSVSTGLPDASLKIPSRSIIMDQSDKSLYAAMYGDGVYRSTDNGATWTKKSTGLFIGNNKHVCSIKQHRDKSLFCLISAKRIGGSGFPDAGGLFKSIDKGETWTNISQKVEGNSPLYYPTAFAVHPENPAIIYLTAINTQGHAQGGLYRTIDGGASWTRYVFPVSDQWGTTAGLGVSLDPKDPSHLLFATESFGVLESNDTGKTWTELAGLPFQTNILVEFDYSAGNSKPVLHVCTYGGGVWTRSPGLAGIRESKPNIQNINKKKSRAFLVYSRNNSISRAVKESRGNLVDAQGRIICKKGWNSTDVSKNASPNKIHPTGFLYVTP